jgi:hypothetical protein
LQTQKTKIILLVIGAAAVYGVAHDEITARLCLEYFTLAHPPLFPTNSPTVLALCWGLAATLGVGLLFGLLLAEVSQSPELPPLPITKLFRPVALVLVVTGLLAALAGCLGYEVSRRSVIVLVEPWADSLPRPQRDRFMAVWFTHSASYLFGLSGAAWVVYRVWKERNQPRIFTLVPRRRSELVRVVLLVMLLGMIVWLRWHSSAARMHQ